MKTGLPTIIQVPIFDSLHATHTSLILGVNILLGVSSIDFGEGNRISFQVEAPPSVSTHRGSHKLHTSLKRLQL